MIKTFLKKSNSKFIFQAYCKNFTSSNLAPFWSNTILQIVNENNDITNDVVKMNTISKLLLQGCLSSISNYPYPLWKFLSLLSSNTVVDVFSFFMINFLAKAVKSPELYGLVEESNFKNNSKVVLKAFSHIIKNYGKREQFFYKDNQMDVNALSNYENIVSQWYLGETGQLYVGYEIDWKYSREEIIHLINWILSNKPKICDRLLGTPPFQRYVECGIDEIIKTLTPLPEPETEPEQPVQQPSLVNNVKKKEKTLSLAQRMSTKFGKKKKDKEKKDDKEN